MKTINSIAKGISLAAALALVFATDGERPTPMLWTCLTLIVLSLIVEHKTAQR